MQDNDDPTALLGDRDRASGDARYVLKAIKDGWVRAWKFPNGLGGLPARMMELTNSDDPRAAVAAAKVLVAMQAQNLDIAQAVDGPASAAKQAAPAVQVIIDQSGRRVDRAGIIERIEGTTVTIATDRTHQDAPGSTQTAAAGPSMGGSAVRQCSKCGEWSQVNGGGLCDGCA